MKVYRRAAFTRNAILWCAEVAILVVIMRLTAHPWIVDALVLVYGFITQRRVECRV